MPRRPPGMLKRPEKKTPGTAGSGLQDRQQIIKAHHCSFANHTALHQGLHRLQMAAHHFGNICREGKPYKAACTDIAQLALSPSRGSKTTLGQLILS